MEMVLTNLVDNAVKYGGDTKAGRRFDWFFSVNGIVAERGSAQVCTAPTAPLHPCLNVRTYCPGRC